MAQTRIISTAALAAVFAAGGAWFLAPAGGPDMTLPGAASAQTADDAQDSADAEASAGEDTAESAPSGEVQDMMLGSADAPVKVIEYASYTCPHCGNFHDTVYDQLKENYIDTDKISFTYREVYFDKYGMWASMIARCGDDTDRFFGITDMLYDSQESWTRAGSEAEIADELRKIGRLAGIDNEQLEACMTDGEKLRSLVEWYQTNAEEDDVTSTPTFIIDGEKYSNMNYEDFSAILDEKLAEAE
ncbi:putative thiol-disulfide oxidoreductase D [Roseivivax marinus]|uniref:Putative thiol-disulfide oxidoreductase D n=1 Tax=Roseivivax marinus TaxID=1379903 RepID=W4HDC9_9RHOB|nr:DsbA family protein [Roseivivax marinus]ETW10744.1 putative thiol-disulfide oxidoreductase D [Roseivivax marinus]